MPESTGNATVDALLKLLAQNQSSTTEKTGVNAVPMELMGQQRSLTPMQESRLKRYQSNPNAPGAATMLRAAGLDPSKYAPSGSTPSSQIGTLQVEGMEKKQGEYNELQNMIKSLIGGTTPNVTTPTPSGGMASTAARMGGGMVSTGGAQIKTGGYPRGDTWQSQPGAGAQPGGAPGAGQIMGGNIATTLEGVFLAGNPSGTFEQFLAQYPHIAEDPGTMARSRAMFDQARGGGGGGATTPQGVLEEQIINRVREGGLGEGTVQGIKAGQTDIIGEQERLAAEDVTRSFGGTGSYGGALREGLSEVERGGEKARREGSRDIDIKTAIYNDEASRESLGRLQDYVNSLTQKEQFGASLSLQERQLLQQSQQFLETLKRGDVGMLQDLYESQQVPDWLSLINSNVPQDILTQILKGSYYE